MKYYKLKNLLSVFRNGATIKQTKNSSGVPISRIETISNGTIDFNKVGYADIYNDNYKEYYLQDGDILFSHINSIPHLGKCAIFQNTDKTLIHGMNLLLLRANKNILSKYLFYLLKSKPFRAKLPTITKKSVNQASLSITNLGDIDVCICSLDEQQRIVKILDKADEIRTKKKLANEKLDEFLKSTFIDMFGDPVINSKQLPKVKLSDMGTLARGKSKHRPRNAPELLNGPYPLIQTGDVANSGLYLKTYNQTYSEIGLKQSKMWNAGTLCITIAANIAKTSILTFNACFPDSIVGFINNDNCNIHYIQFWLMFLQAVLEAEAPQSAQKNINLEILNSLELPYPPIEQQNQFAQIVQKVEAQKEKNQEIIEQMDNLFNSLMHQAFNSSL